MSRIIPHLHLLQRCLCSPEARGCNARTSPPHARHPRTLRRCLDVRRAGLALVRPAVLVTEHSSAPAATHLRRYRGIPDRQLGTLRAFPGGLVLAGKNKPFVPFFNLFCQRE